METTLVSKENNQAELIMDFTADEFVEAIDKVYKKTRKNFVINGFRKGKAPRKIIEARYGQGIFFEDAINDLFSANYPQALRDNDLEVISDPQVDFSSIEEGKPLKMTIKVGLFPIVEVKDYKGISVEQLNVKVEDSEIEERIEQMRKSHARVETVERPAENGDTVKLDYKGTIDGQEFSGGSADDMDLKLGSNTFIPGFEDGLVGVSAGEEKDVTVTFPDDYQAKDLAGKDAVFHCVVKEVSHEELPELTDDFVADVTEFDTVDEMKKDMRETMESDKADANKEEAKADLIEKLVEANDVDVPAVMIEDEVTNDINEMDQQMRYQGLSFDQYLNILGKTMDEVKNEIRPDSEKKVVRRILLRSVAEAENIEVSDEDVDNEFERLSKQYGLKPEDIRKSIGENNMNFVKNDIKVNKAIDFLYDNADVKFVDEKTPAEEAKADEAEEADEKSAKAEKKHAKTEAPSVD
ncbi:MAG: trigger factor [Eubacteriales bacterium]|nr:trigger factor [Eubacteriales bacterium]